MRSAFRQTGYVLLCALCSLLSARAQDVTFEILPLDKPGASGEIPIVWNAPFAAQLDLQATPPQALVHLKGKQVHSQWGLVADGRKVDAEGREGSIEFDVVVTDGTKDIKLQLVDLVGKIQSYVLRIGFRDWQAALDRQKSPYYQRPFRLLRFSAQAVGGLQISGDGLGISGQLGWLPLLKFNPTWGMRLSLAGTVYRAQETRLLFPALEYEVLGGVWFKQFELDVGGGAQTWFGFSTFPQASVSLRRELPEFCSFFCTWARSAWISGQWSPYHGDHIVWVKAGLEFGR